MQSCNDTDTLLALVSSLLTKNQPDTDIILEALVHCNGDVEATAKFLSGSEDVQKTKKRKRADLDSWLSKSPETAKHSKPETSRERGLDIPTSESPQASSSRQPPVVNLMSVLRPPPSSKSSIPQQPPLTLSNPEMVAQNTPCTLHLSVLPPELACRLFHTMVRASRNWKRNKWWLFDRLVESPHRTAFFARKDDGIDRNQSWQEAAQYWYNGRKTDPPEVFPPAMEAACHIIEGIVNDQLSQRQRFPLEWGSGNPEAKWRANVAASNCYDGSKESVGFHSDQLTYLGPYPTIASLSLGTTRIFSLREVIPAEQAKERKARTFNIPLPHNSLTIMHASCQERFKHSIPPQPTVDVYRPAYPETPGADIEPSKCRINITFRFYRPDFRPPSTPRSTVGPIDIGGLVMPALRMRGKDAIFGRVIIRRNSIARRYPVAEYTPGNGDFYFTATKPHSLGFLSPMDESLVNRFRPSQVQLALLCFLRLLDPLNFTQIFPYVNELVKDLHVSEDPSKVGFYSGLLESSFAVCQMLMMFPWGFVSDTVGRRPVILAGVAGLSVTTVWFGLSKSFATALAVRAIAGLFSGNVAVIPSVLCDITDRHNQADAFAFFGLWWPLGAIIGPFVGGTLTNPATKYPRLFNHPFFHSYPYFLPSFVVSGITAMGFVLNFCWLEETLHTKIRMASRAVVPTYVGADDLFEPRSTRHSHSIHQLLAIPLIKALCMSSCVLSFVSTAFDVLFVLFCYYPIYLGGLGFSASEIGYALALSGVIAAALQLLAMPAILHRFNHAKMYHFCMKIWPCVFLSLPLLNTVARQGLDAGRGQVLTVAIWVLIAAVLLAARVAFLAYSINMVLVKAHSKASALGSTYALVQFFICLSRSFSPAFASYVFTASPEAGILRGYSWALIMAIMSSAACYFSRRIVSLDELDARSLTSYLRPPRPSADHEAAPLLSDPETEERNGAPAVTFSERVETIAQEPLTPLTKILLVLTLVLLLLSSVFIGLFAGVRHQLKLERGRHDGGGGELPTATVTTTVTATSIATSTQKMTSTSTTTHTTTVIPPPGPTNRPEEETCLTPQCILLSGAILSSLDTSRDPCENFYDFATGGWLRAHPLPADKGSFGNFEALAQQNKQVIQRILEPKSTSISFNSTHDTEILRKLRDLYSSCLNEDTLDDIGVAPLSQFVQTLRRIFRRDTSDIDTEDKKDSTDLTAALAYLHSQGIDALFSFDIEGDVGRDPNHMALWFSQADLGLPSKEYYNDKSVLRVYQDVIEHLLLILSDEDESGKSVRSTDAAVMVTNEDSKAWPPWPWPPWGEDGDDKGDDKKPVNKTRRAHKLAKKIVKLEERLAEASLDLDVLLQNPIATYNPVPLTHLTDALPQIDFPAYFSSFTPRTFPETVVMTYPAYASALGEILDDTSSNVLEAYLIVRAALTLAPHLGTSTEAWQAQRSLYELLTGIKKGAVGDRSEYCVGKVEETLGFAIGRYFVNETFGGDSREQATKVISDIVEAFKASLIKVEWMDEKSRKAAAEKADAIRVKVGFPLSPDTRDPDSIARYYDGVKVNRLTFFENMISATKNDRFKKWLQLGRRRDPRAWEMYPSMVNAYFNPPANEIVFPAGILQPPFFETGWPSYMSYGAFGHVAAHELTHAFDSAGRLYNQEGKLEEWWTNSTSEGFKVKQDCIVKQYSVYTIDDGKGGKIHVNGNLTSGENIGDTGLIQAYRAWKAQYDVSFTAGNEFLLPGLTFTREQLFFISFARIWARAVNPAAAVQRIRTDPHSPSRYRVDGTVFNIPEFAKAFNCPKNVKLNPPMEDRCLFW
ncbi:putative peptidase family M13 [Lyophyllum shimeji]|uniref:Peptidase family M13 n=1 Tax=Lyophyllum shimeji TaxID=47721 RepID=A0A9P3PFJ3_LYOSH|nr:putative peptidase family M13 [Lyophyllum shimeji]